MSSFPAIASFRFDTDDHPAEDRVEMWRSVVSVTHDSTPLEPGATPFRSNYRLWHLRNLAVSSGSYWAQTFTRTSDAIRHDQIDHIGFFVLGRGTRVSQIGDQVIHVGAFDVQITDFAQTERSFASAGNSGTLYLPRDLAEDLLPNISGFHGRVLPDSMANLFAHHILNLGTHLAEMPQPAIPHLTTASIELALATLQSLDTGSWDMPSTVAFAMRRRVERYIETQIESPSITPQSVALACAMSRSTLYRLFEPHGGIMSYVKRRRLHRIRTILIANVDVRPLSEISEDYGFQSGAHFSREFRREFGCPPGEVRGDPFAPRSSQTDYDSSLELILRTLGS